MHPLPQPHADSESHGQGLNGKKRETLWEVG